MARPPSEQRWDAGKTAVGFRLCMMKEIEPSPRPAQFDRNPGLTPPHEVHKTGLVLEGMQTTERGLPAEEPWTESC